MKTLALIIFAARLSYGQTVVNPTEFTMDNTTLAALGRWMMTQTTTDVNTTLTVAVDAVTTSFQMASGSGWGATSAFVIDGKEIIQCTAKPTGSSATCTRGQVGSAAVAHAAGVSVKELLYKTPATASGAIAKAAVVQICLADPVINASVTSAAAAAQAAVVAGVQ